MRKRGYRTNKRMLRAAFPAMLLAVSMMTGCGASGGSSYDAKNGMPMAEEAVAEEYMDGGIYGNAAGAVMEKAEAGVAEGAEAKADVQDMDRKLIKNVDMSVETEAFDTLLANVKQKVDALGGYIENSNIYNGSYTSNYRSRSASITARIPAQRLDDFVSDVAEQSNVMRKNEYVEDVTLRYVDLESHKKALQAEQKSLLSMLESAQTIEDIITINAQLTDVRYQIESMESQLRTYDNKINYSTINLDIEEVAVYTPYVPKSAGERISEGFVRNLYRVGNGVKEFVIELIIALPLILTAAIIIGMLAGITYVIIRAGEKRAAKNKEKREQLYGRKQTAQGGLRHPGGTPERRQVNPDESSHRTEDSNHVQ